MTQILYTRDHRAFASRHTLFVFNDIIILRFCSTICPLSISRIEYYPEVLPFPRIVFPPYPRDFPLSGSWSRARKMEITCLRHPSYTAIGWDKECGDPESFHSSGPPRPLFSFLHRHGVICPRHGARACQQRKEKK